MHSWLVLYTSPTLSYGYGLELVQLPQQTGALSRMQAINKLLGSSGRVEGLHGLLQRVCAQVTPLHHRREERLRGEPRRGRSGGCLVAVEPGCGQPGAGSQREGGPEHSPQAGQHLWDGGEGGWCRVKMTWWRTTQQARLTHWAWIHLKKTTHTHTWREDSATIWIDRPPTQPPSGRSLGLFKGTNTHTGPDSDNNTSHTDYMSVQAQEKYEMMRQPSTKIQPQLVLSDAPQVDAPLSRPTTSTGNLRGRQRSCSGSYPPAERERHTERRREREADRPD